MLPLVVDCLGAKKNENRPEKSKIRRNSNKSIKLLTGSKISTDNIW